MATNHTYINNLMQSIKKTLPDKKEEILYIYNMVGQALFKENWYKFKVYDTTNEEECNIFYSYLQLIKTLNNDEKNKIMNFIFQETMNMLG